MRLPFELLLTQTSAAGLSEAEILSRFPILKIAAIALFLLGLACDVWLLLCLRRGGPVLQVSAKPWGLRELAFVAGIILGVLLTSNGVLALIVHAAQLDDEATYSVLLSVEMTLRLLLLLGLGYFVRTRSAQWREALGFSSRSGFISGVIGYLAILPPLGIVMATIEAIAHALGIEPSPQPVAELLTTSDSMLVVGLIVGFAVVLAPLFEEILFRGFAYPALKQRWGVGRAMFYVSLVFAAMHLHGPSLAPLFALSLALGFAYEVTGSLVASITMHALFNATNVAMLLYVRAHL